MTSASQGKGKVSVEAKNNRNGLPAIEKVIAACEALCGGKNDSRPDFESTVKESGRSSLFRKREISEAEGTGMEVSDVAKTGRSCGDAGFGSNNGLTPFLRVSAFLDPRANANDLLWS